MRSGSSRPSALSELTQLRNVNGNGRLRLQEAAAEQPAAKRARRVRLVRGRAELVVLSECDFKIRVVAALALVVIQLRGAGPKSGTLPVTTTLAEALFLFVRAAFIPTMTMLPPSHSAGSMPHHQHLACKKPKDALLRIVETAVEWFGGVGDLLHGGSGF